MKFKKAENSNRENNDNKIQDQKNPLPKKK